MGFLRMKSGDIMMVTVLARKFMVGQAAMTTLLNEMAIAGKVRRSSAKRSLGFYVPSEAQLEAERKALQAVKQTPPLKIDKRRQELYAEIAASRKSLPSIG